MFIVVANFDNVPAAGVEDSLLQELGAIGYNMTLKEGYMSVVTSVSSIGNETEALGTVLVLSCLVIVTTWYCYT